MRGEKRHFGYTIVEVMIVLAVSGMMFAIATSFVGGKQAKTAFTAGTNELASRLQDTIEQVTDGQYSDIPLNCSFTEGGTAVPSAGSGETQGRNNQCIFLGKLLHFSVNSQPAKYEMFSVAGGRVDSDDKPIVNLSQAGPAVIGELTVEQDIPQQLEVIGVKVISDSGIVETSYIVGFFQGQGSLDQAGSLMSGAQSVALYYARDAGPDLTSEVAAGPLTINGTKLIKASKIKICVTDGTRYASLNLGDQGSQLNVNVKFHGPASAPPNECTSF